MNTNFDELFDSALAKDKARLPEQPGLPDASLKAKLASTPPPPPAMTAVGSGASGFALSQFGMLGLGFLGVSIAAYFYFQEPSAPAPAQNSVLPRTNEIIQSPPSVPE